jgi:hypothetical protein
VLEEGINGGRMKKKSLVLLTAIIMISVVLIGCATATPVPQNATPEQIAQINAENIAATATNTSTLAIIQIVSLIVGFLSGLLASGY